MADELNDDGWPTFEVPADVHREDPDPAAQPDPAAAANQPPATTPNQPPAQPPAGTPPAPLGGAPAGEQGELIPKHRLDETIADRNRLAAQLEAQTQQIATLTAIVQRVAGGQPPADPNAPPAAPPVDPKDQQIRDRMLAVFPEFKKLLELTDLADRKADLLGVVGDSQRWRTAEQQISDQFVQTSTDGVLTKAAVLTLGEGKTGKDLNPLVQQSILAAFSRFVTSDPELAKRFDRHDPAVADEFWAAYKAAAYDPIRRDSHAQLLERAATPPAIPQGGTQAPPAPAAPKPPDPNDEDAIHGQAWNARGQFAGSTR